MSGDGVGAEIDEKAAEWFETAASAGSPGSSNTAWPNVVSGSENRLGQADAVT
ncbi:hypothetical protein O9929_13320 [Vibrio lentus]|nr:hypothetical protein [Vibrio lentus]